MSYVVTKGSVSGGGGVIKFTTDDATVVTPTLGNINMAGGANVSSTGAGSTVTFSITGTTNHAIQLGNVTGSLTSLLGTTNTALLGVTAGNPIFGTVPNATLTNSSMTFTGGDNITFTGSPVSLGGGGTIAVSGTTENSLQLGNASGSLTSLGVATNGQLAIGSTGGPPVLNTLTAGSNVTVTNAAGSITIASTGGGGPGVGTGFLSVLNVDKPNQTGSGGSGILNGNMTDIFNDGLWNKTTGIYSPPATGIYMVSAFIRLINSTAMWST
ncbi:hypothetical protein LCGC14_2813710, partial [marine sediment metagenome]